MTKAVRFLEGGLTQMKAARRLSTYQSVISRLNLRYSEEGDVRCN